MKPIEGWENITESGDFRKLPAGIYPVRITSVKDNVEGQYFEITCDIIKGEFKDFFKQQVAAGLKDGSKSIRSYKDAALPFFKGFITAIEKTNPGYHWDWDETKLVGKNVVAVFGDEEYLKDGQVKVGTKLVEFRSLEAYKEGKITIPPLKKLSAAELAQPVPAQPEAEKVELVPDDDFPF